MFGYQFRGEHVFLFGCRIVWIGALVVKGIDGQFAIDQERFFFLLPIEQQSATESAHGRLARLV